jgi:hypothetical protein
MPMVKQDFMLLAGIISVLRDSTKCSGECLDELSYRIAQEYDGTYTLFIRDEFLKAAKFLVR